MKTRTKNESRRRGFTLVELLVVISIIVVLSGLATPVAVRALNHADQVTGINNARNIKGALDLFASDFDGSYPSDQTALELADLNKESDDSASSPSLQGQWDLEPRNSGRNSDPSKTSDHYFSQLIGRGLDSEELFSMKSFRRDFQLRRSNNDGVFDSGENVWGYTKNLQPTSSGHIPIIYDNPVSTGENPRFSKKTWGGKIIVARLNNSTQMLQIGGQDRHSGRVTEPLHGERVNLFSQEALEEGILVPANLKKL